MTLLERVRMQQGEETIEVDEDFQDEIRNKLKRDLMGRLGLPVVAQMAANSDKARARTELSVACQTILHSNDYSEVNEREHASLIREVVDEVVGLGPLQPLLDDPSITEVMINGCDSLFYERDGVMQRTARVFKTTEQILMVVDRILAPLGRRLDESSPIVNARLSNGDRVNVVSTTDCFRWSCSNN